MRHGWKAAAAGLLAIGLLAGCAGANEGGKQAQQTAPASSQPAAGSEAALPSDGERQDYHFDLTSTAVEPLPKWAGTVDMTKKDPLYISGTDLEGALTADIKLSRKGGYLVASGEGVIWNGQRSVKFVIADSAVLEKKLNADGTLVYGALQARADEIDRSFSFDMRLVPEAGELELRLPNKDGLILFGQSAVLGKHQDEVAKVTAGM